MVPELRRVEVEVTTEPREGLAALYRDEHQRVVRLAFLLTGHSGVAEEIAHDAFIKVWGAWDRIHEPRAYLRKAVVNLSRSSLRRRSLELRHLARREETAIDVDPSLRMEILDALRGLPSRQRACVVLRYYDDLSEQETADILGVSVGTVKSQTHKALRRLEGLLNTGGEDHGS